MNARTVNAKLRQARMMKVWTQEEVAEQIGASPLSVSRWEGGKTFPNAYYRQQLIKLFGMTTEALGLVCNEAPQPSQPLSHWLVPFPRNPLFTGRTALLAQLHVLFCTKQPIALTQSYALSGLGGIGKTQIALEYAYQHRSDYAAVLWVNAETPETLQTGLAAVAECLQLPEMDDHDRVQMIVAIKKWLASHQNWLLILDNADDMTIVLDLLPAAGFGHLLLTTRAQALGAVAQRIEIETMGIAEATLFLLRRAKLLAPGASLDQALPEHLAIAEAIAIEMGFLPLALEQAGAYIEEVGCGLVRYLELFRTHHTELLRHRGHLSGEYPASVATTWSLNFQRIEQSNPATAELLQMCAFLEPDAIPEELFTEGTAYWPPVLQQAAADPFVFDQMIGDVLAFSLVKRSIDDHVLSIHRLVQVVIRDTMEMEERQAWANRVIQVTHLVFPKTAEVATWDRCRRYLSQAHQCASLIQEFGVTSEQAGSLLFSLATYLYHCALYAQAESLYLRVVSMYEQVYGSEHLEVATVLYHVGILYQKQGRYEHAYPVHARALHIREHVYGPEHPEVALSLLRLGTISSRQGNHQQAESYCLRAWQIWEQTRGLNHPGSAMVLDTLGNAYTRMDAYGKAEHCYLQALHLREQTLGPDHFNMATLQSNLGDLYLAQQKYEQAEPLFHRALHIWEQHLPPHHLYLAYPLVGLAKIYVGQQKYEQAEPLLKRALHIWGRIQEQHPDSVEVLDAFAVLREAQGKSQEAAMFSQQALAIREQVGFI